MQKKCLRCGEPTRPGGERCSRCNSTLEGQTPFINSASQGKPDNGYGLLISVMVVVVSVVLGAYMTFFRASDKPVPVPVAPPPTAAPTTISLSSNSAPDGNTAARAKMLKEMDDRAKAAANAAK